MADSFCSVQIWWVGFHEKNVFLIVSTTSSVFDLWKDGLYDFRNEFDEDNVPQLDSEVYLQDIHSISSVLKMYFRELPNPLFTYQLYDQFAVS